jgi:hypothetical protein
LRIGESVISFRVPFARHTLAIFWA